MRIAPADTAAELAAVRALLAEYGAALGLPPAVVVAELAGLPGDYAPPRGTLLLARDAGPDGWAAAGCVGVRPLDEPGDCELKRLFIRPVARRGGRGRALVTAALAWAVAAGYRRMLLDTLSTMGPAQALYRGLGFAAVSPYRVPDRPDKLFLGRNLL